MAWTNIPDDVLEPGKPIRSVDAIALRDNPIAIAQGLPGAPRIGLQAIQPLSAGDIVQSQLLTTVTTTGIQTHAIWGFIQSGFIRVTLEHASNISGINASASVARIRNGVLTVLQSWSTTSTSFVFRSVDVSISPGDTIVTQHAPFLGYSGHASVMRNSRFLSNGEAWWPSPTNINFGG